MVDRQVVTEKVAFLEENLAKLRRLAKLPREDFLGDFLYFDTAKHNLQTAIEVMLDVANHIIAFHRWRIPEGNADAFRVLREHAVITAEDCAVFERMARFQNRVVNLYADVDPGEVHRLINENLEDFERFIASVPRRFLAPPSVDAGEE